MPTPRKAAKRPCRYDPAAEDARELDLLADQRACAEVLRAIKESAAVAAARAEMMALRQSQQLALVAPPAAQEIRAMRFLDGVLHVLLGERWAILQDGTEHSEQLEGVIFERA